MAAIICRKGDRGNQVKVVQRLLHLYPDGVFGQLTEEGVMDFQRKAGLSVDGIVGIGTWSRLVGNVLLPSKRDIREIIVHCTATPEGVDYTVDDIRRWHTSPPNNWADIGYHYIVYRDGQVKDGRDVNTAGAHCTGHNTASIGVVYVGGTAKDGSPKDTRTGEQKQALAKLLRQLKVIYPDASIHGHRDFAAKACPSYDATKEYKGI